MGTFPNRVYLDEMHHNSESHKGPHFCRENNHNGHKGMHVLKLQSISLIDQELISSVRALVLDLAQPTYQKSMTAETQS